MKPSTKLSTWLSVFFVVISSASLMAIYKIQNYRAYKIEFILQDRLHENIANLPKLELVEYLEASGAEVVDSGGELGVSYTGIFIRKNWTVKLNQRAE